MRDKTGFPSNFNGLIIDRKSSIVKFKAAIKNGIVTKERVQFVNEAIIGNSIKIVIAQYSAGESKEVISNSLQECVADFVNGFKWEGKDLGYGQYEQMLWLCSLGVLFDISKDEFKRLTTIIQRDKVKDKLLDFIINAKLGVDWPKTSQSYIEPIPYKNVDNFSSASEIKKYLDSTWYNEQGEASWHDRHLNTKVNSYFGYWAWETAAIAKIKKIDYSDLKNQKYYPYDAVHW